ncbi:hypothetical protein GN244_ATG19371 [Phytophthora infestans]|uniref:Uncharacterized protein n=1 Tax=Phytophthora infestans TaxID=4787 RepID=A0A833W452_PHYIN|nr:hypothetical protein GN244_ATG19371 [Phytophthora infestans]
MGDTRSGDGSPRAQQQSGGFRRQGSVDERIRSGSGSFAAPDDHADDDASMSNDESMSSSSSFDQLKQQEQHLKQARGPSGRTKSFNDFARQLPYQDPSLNVAPRSTSFSFEVVDASLMQIQVQIWRMTNLSMMKNQAAQVNEAPQSRDQTANRSGNRRVTWASSTAHVELPEDTSNWLLPLGHGPRARVGVDTRFVPPHNIKVEAFVVGTVEDANSDIVMETLERTGVSAKAMREQAVYLRVRVGENLDPGVYELPLRVFTQARLLLDVAGLVQNAPYTSWCRLIRKQRSSCVRRCQLCI